MIKDILVNLPVLGSRDPVTSFAASVAARFGAHSTGVAFLYEPLMPVMVDMYGVPPDVIQVQRIENEELHRDWAVIDHPVNRAQRVFYRRDVDQAKIALPWVLGRPLVRTG